MGYTTADDVYAACKLTSSEVPEASVDKFILAAERYVDRITNTTYWAEENSGTASSATANTITESGAGWTADAYNTNYVWVYSGTGSGQMREILDNDTDTLTVDRNWDTTPDNTSKFRIIYTATDAYVSDDFDGTGDTHFFLERYPLGILESVEIAGDSVTPSTIYQYKDIGKLEMSEDSEESRFSNSKPQQCAVAWWFGVYDLPAEVERYVVLYAAIMTLNAQMGGTYNDATSYRLPEGEVGVGEPYINIKNTMMELQKEKKELEFFLIKYPYIA